MRSLTTLCLFVCLTFTLKAQSKRLGYSRNEIIASSGYNYDTGTNDNGYKYIAYSHYNNYGLVSEAYYFNNQSICIFFRYIYPIEAINEVIKELNSNFVQTDKWKWKDYSKDMVYILTKDDNQPLIFDLVGNFSNTIIH